MSFRSVLLMILMSFLFFSCKKNYEDFSNYEVISNSYTGELITEEAGETFKIDFSGIYDSSLAYPYGGESGQISFILNNSNKIGNASLDLFPIGIYANIHLTIFDSNGDQVLNEPLSSDHINYENYDYETKKGRKGNWKIVFDITNFTGEGTLKVNFE